MTAAAAIGLTFDHDALGRLFVCMPDPTTVKEAEGFLRNEDVQDGDWNISDALNAFAVRGGIPVLYADEYAYEMEGDVASATLAQLRNLVWHHLVNLRQVDAHARAMELTRDGEAT